MGHHKTTSVIEKMMFVKKEKKEEKKKSLDKLICFMKYSLNENGHNRTHLRCSLRIARWIFLI